MDLYYFQSWSNTWVLFLAFCLSVFLNDFSDNEKLGSHYLSMFPFFLISCLGCSVWCCILEWIMPLFCFSICGSGCTQVCLFTTRFSFSHSVDMGGCLHCLLELWDCDLMCDFDHGVHLAQQETNMLNAGSLLFTHTHTFYN